VYDSLAQTEQQTLDPTVKSSSSLASSFFFAIEDLILKTLKHAPLKEF